eukprot:4200038-Prymnesium_polylepis.1
MEQVVSLMEPVVRSSERGRDAYRRHSSHNQCNHQGSHRDNHQRTDGVHHDVVAVGHVVDQPREVALCERRGGRGRRGG